MQLDQTDRPGFYGFLKNVPECVFEETKTRSKP